MISQSTATIKSTVNFVSGQATDIIRSDLSFDNQGSRFQRDDRIIRIVFIAIE